jgi:hypothetical protein
MATNVGIVSFLIVLSLIKIQRIENGAEGGVLVWYSVVLFAGICFIILVLLIVRLPKADK